MDFSVSEDDRAVAEAVADFARRELAPHAHARDETGEFIARHLPKLAEMGVMGLNLPAEWGGAGASAKALAMAVEAIAGACAGTASAVTAHYLATEAVLVAGDDDLRGRYLPEAAVGRKLGAFALSEPRAGSDPADMRTRARREGDGYRIEGTKHFISNGGIAEFVVVFALSDVEAGHRGISAFVVDTDTPGFAAGTAEPTMGLRAGHVFELSFDCVVPAEHRLGAEGSGFKTAMKVLDAGRIDVAAMCLGIAQAAYDAAVSWAKERRVGGQPIADFQGLRWMLADMATDLDAARLLTMRAAWLRDSGARYTKQAAMAKLHASEAVGRITDLALQIHGGYGYTRAMPLERYVRDARVMRIYEGTSEIQRNIIAGQLLREA